ncbi:MAG: DUF3016 domain-containing protein [Verrucomicrobiota bacterium]
MKTIISISLMLCAAGLLPALAQEDKPTIEATVELKNPKEFHDLRIGFASTQKDFDKFKRDITEYLEQKAPRYLPDGARLHLTFTEVDMAGRIEIRRGTDIRVMRDIYAPQLEFTYKIESATGETLVEGETREIGVGYLTDYHTGARLETFEYEQFLLRDWLREISDQLEEN